MANITINEISQNYTYNIGNNSYATVALPITAQWGPGYEDPEAKGITEDEEVLESIPWSRFPATQAGLESFVSTFRGPTTQYMLHQDYSYQMAMTLLTSGYDILVTRVATGSKAKGNIYFQIKNGDADPTDVSTPFGVSAKYLGSFGNSLQVDIRKLYRISESRQIPYWNCLIYIVSTSGVRTAVENLNFVFDVEKATETILHIDEIESKFLEFSDYPDVLDENDIDLDTVVIPGSQYEAAGDIYDPITGIYTIKLSGGSDLPASDSGEAALNKAVDLAKLRYSCAYTGVVAIDQATVDDTQYLAGADCIKPDGTRINVSLSTSFLSGITEARKQSIFFREWMFTAAFGVLSTLQDKLAYNPNRIIVPGWDDQDYRYLANDNTITCDITNLSPLHIKLMDMAYLSRCATSYIDIPKCITKKFIYNEILNADEQGYAQRLSRHMPKGITVSGSIYSSHSALFAPWGKYAYVGGSKQSIASPSFLALIIDRAMIKNQTSQYEWELPVNRRHNLKIGKMDYTISKKYLDKWQKLEGVGVNCITQIPDLGLSIWGNSTLYEVPPATYQALANLSTRKLVNAVEDLAYRCGIAITFQYNNEQAYNAFYAGMTPLLDTMRNVGAIEDYYLRMSEDVNGLDQVNANSVIGKIYLVIDGVINDINIDLIALPPNTDLDQFRV